MVVAIAFLMEQLDATIVTTAIPAMAHTLRASVVQMSLAVSAYVLTLAVFIPLSGWLADRFGARRVFIAALGLFTLGSVLCGVADSFPMLVAMRMLQGLGGAMMTPVGRLILLRSFPRADLVRAMTYATLPAIVGPVIGPLLGGWLTTALSWRWIFFVNLPFGLLGMALAARVLRDDTEAAPPAFDLWGFALFGVAVGLLQFAMEGVTHLPAAMLAAMTVGAVVLLLAFVRHGRRRAHPAVDLTLLRERAFGIATLAGGLCRMAMNAPVYLLPILLQVGLGMTPVQSGALTFLSALASPVVRLFVGTGLRWLGFRRLLLVSAVACSGSLASFALVGPHLAMPWIAAAIIVYGLVRSTQFMISNTLAYADIPASRLSRATSLGGLLQQLTVSFGVSLGAAWLGLLAPLHTAPTLATFHLTFVVLAVLPLLAVPAFARLQPHDGAVVSGHAAPGPVDETASSPPGTMHALSASDPTMALKATIYKADLQVADMDRHYYADHALTIARHPSETDERMMVRVLLYALYAQEGMALTKGLFDVDEPDLWVKDLTGAITLWIDIGQPDESRVRKACARAQQVVVVCHASSCPVWWKQIAGKLARLPNLTVLRLPAETSQALAGLTARTMQLQCLVQDGAVTLSSAAASVAVELETLQRPT